MSDPKSTVAESPKGDTSLAGADLAWSKDALVVLKNSLAEGLSPDDLGGKIAFDFGLGLEGVFADTLPPSRIRRSEVFSLAIDPNVNTVTVCAAIMAWGGMNQRFRNGFFSLADSGWLKLADSIREGKVHRSSAYDAFSALREEKKLYGVGPAYFTKMIYFLTPRSSPRQEPAYIMDQWAGCSINLLLAQELVKMDVIRKWEKEASAPKFTYMVSDANTGENYEKFCNAAEALRLHLNLTHDETDRLMLANGGKNKSSWRKYVIGYRSI
ncbi:8-oxoguanine DNA glycosylase OGG fold protein [Maritalea mediterranea]|uniref:Uncharacterized protein n=1 Tax=Maritalea mediterranea TaxID=2909667 RepID=A0ABS9E5Q2_9HYPH|nr:hypothetical protein [Maritalea mediterranea]MCF4098198.1 hypothetical protein [Maritalea mediterranea]